MFLLSYVLCAVLSLGGVLAAEKPKPKAKPKAAPVEVYDPDKLGPGEVACGRPHSVKSPPCECMKHRVAEADKARERCYGIVDRDERIKCAMAASPCAVKVVDAESAIYSQEDDGSVSTSMPAQCKRTCRKARCECCHS
jgi:hypothetical protein